VAGARGPLPIVVGVTGHRDLREEDVPQLRARVIATFDELLAQYPHTPLLVLSPLAAGADRLVARAAMDHVPPIPVIAPLPFENPEYERDFKEPEDLAEFRELYDRAKCAYFVGYVPGNDATTVVEHDARNKQYAQVGSYVARNSRYLIALWNGIASQSVGGTAQIVRFKREGRTDGFGPELGPLDRPEYGPVIQIVTPRAADPSALSAPAFSRSFLWPIRPQPPAAEDKDEPSDEDVTRKMHDRIDRFNADAVRGLGSAAVEMSSATILIASERLAKFYQRMTFGVLKGLYAAGLAATVAFVLYAHTAGHRRELLWAYIGISLLALAAYGAARFTEVQNRHLDYRAIAEGLRVQEQWQAAGVRETVADHYLRQHRGELDWIRSAIRVCRLLDETAARDELGDLTARRTRLQRALDEWIQGPNGQITFFTNRVRDSERLVRIFTVATWVSIALASAITAATVYFYDARGWPIDESPLWIAAIVAISIAAVLSGLLASYAEKRAYEIHVKRYRRMRSIFRQAGTALDEILSRVPFREEDYANAQRLMRDVGREALLENAAWVILHRERPMEFVQGG
jgi:hypothetical protein